MLGMLGAGAPIHAAVPTYVVEIELNTKFERSLERFLFDLFNTLQRRDEDFTAAFELQKIEKAREDTAKLFQEVEAELTNFGLAYSAYDRRLDPTGKNESPLFISPVRDNRIIHDPIGYLVDEPAEYGKIIFACFMNYIIWDQKGDAKMYGNTSDIPGRTNNAITSDEIAAVLTAIDANTEKKTFSLTKNIEALEAAKQFTIINNSSSWPFYEQSDGDDDLQDDVLALSGTFLDHENVDFVLPLCNAAFELYRIDTPEIALKKVLYGTSNIEFATPASAAAARARFVRNSLGFPQLRNASEHGVTTYEELDAIFFGSDNNTLSGVLQRGSSLADVVARSVSSLHRLNYEIGQGLRPENLYLSLGASDLAGNVGGVGGALNKQTLTLNTELVISPAVVLLQKMQAATQATFDLAGQGFLYLDAESTPDEILGRYNLVSTRANEEERKICNNAGACQLLDAWLKPAASFRSVATLDGTQTTPQIIGPEVIGGELEIPGSGLPAPWEDESPYVFISPEESIRLDDSTLHARRYTISRFRNSLGGEDEADNDNLVGTHPDNIGNKYAGADFPINDYFDRVFEMYEAGIGRNKNIRKGVGDYAYGLNDWECSIALWFRKKNPGPNTFITFAGITFGTINVEDTFSLDHCGLSSDSEDLSNYID